MKENETCENRGEDRERVRRSGHTKDGNNRQYMIDETVREERK